ncbi:SH3 domain-containing protein [Rhizobium paknamense]|uniref:Uncharacterized protein YraI n=1 Tax=Rhizobium paknamense TaxID=1206817 RepID=A0ABU0ID70_9HYPH|nr:SH3 domain-containing protein [Rhizobium paknamense]MDQ0456196.1 uncharacterized protein YraI [Rhizobium paknamense]
MRQTRIAARLFCRLGILLPLLVTGTSQSAAQTVIPAPSMTAPAGRVQAGPQGGVQGGMPDPYLYHITGLPQGASLDVRSGAGPAFRVIASLPEGTPVDMQNCMESRGGYWCRIATFERPRISGWVDGRFITKDGGEPPGTIGGMPGEIIIDPYGGKGGKNGQQQGNRGNSSGNRFFAPSQQSDTPEDGSE